MANQYKCEQLSVFLENRAGKLNEVIHHLARGGINLRAMSLADTSDFGILRFIADNQKQAEAILKEHGFTTGRTAVLAIEGRDEPGALDRILSGLAGEDINVEYMYAFMPRQPGKCILIFRFDKLDRAIEILLDQGLCLIAQEELSAL